MNCVGDSIEQITNETLMSLIRNRLEVIIIMLQFENIVFRQLLKENRYTCVDVHTPRCVTVCRGDETFLQFYK